jgi:hypothetical protein
VIVGDREVNFDYFVPNGQITHLLHQRAFHHPLMPSRSPNRANRARLKSTRKKLHLRRFK